MRQAMTKSAPAGRGRQRNRLVLGICLGLLACSADSPLGDAGCCNPPTEPPTGLSDVPGLLISDPLPEPVLGGTGKVTWVALAAGMVPNGSTSQLHSSSGGTATGTLAGGGFDPVALQAELGDTITVTVADASGRILVTWQATVKTAKPPVLVRTEPPPRKRDVPLNASLLIVFSEPMNPGTVTMEMVRLFKGTVPVAGQVQLDSSGVKAVFQPAAALDPSTEYTLDITAGLEDLGGDPLAAPVTVGFETQSDLSLVAGSYDRETPHSLPGYHSRYVLRPDGSFELQYETVTWGTFAYTGHYWLADSVIGFSFDGWSRAGPWVATGTVVSDSVVVVNYNVVMQMSDFEDGVYARGSTIPHYLLSRQTQQVVPGDEASSPAGWRAGTH